MDSPTYTIENERLLIRYFDPRDTYMPKETIDSVVNNVDIKSVTRETESMARQVVIKGLSERFDTYDSGKNPDLDNIIEAYIGKDDIFLVGVYTGEVICTGALIKEDDDTGRIVRMSVDNRYRGRGIAVKMIKELEKYAKALGYAKILLETNSDWLSAIRLYIRCGYKVFREDEECTHFIKTLNK